MQRTIFDCLGRRIELWTHPEPDHLATAIRAARGFYEPDVLMKCREIHIPGTVIIDVGANIGNHTVFSAAILGAEVVAIEPFAANYDVLRINIAANGLEQRVRTHAVALGARPGLGCATIGDTRNLGTVQVRAGVGAVRIVTLDSIAEDRPVGVIKIDVEGGEAGVLQGAAATLARWLPDIMVEADGAERFDTIARRLHEIGYAMRGRYAWTPTYLFSATDQAARMRGLVGRVPAMA